MNARHLLGLLVFGTALVLGGASAPAAAPWGNMLVSQKVEADRTKTYTLVEENGPWMIMACSFSGKGAQDQAQELVYELRKRYKFPAFIHKVRFDLKQVQGRGIDRYGQPLKMRYQRGSEIEEYAVLVGSYTSVEDPEAQKVLQTLKYSQPDCLKVQNGKQTHQSLSGWRMIQRELQEKIGSQNKEKGPMGHAFVTTNPLLPKEYFAPRGIDPLVLQMNAGVKCSLLDCPGRYTVQVAKFTGAVIIDPKEIQAIENGKELKSGLAQAADKAHRLTEALRQKGYEAYEFHDRYASIVTVGSFDNVGSPRADGKIEIHPKIHAIMKTFGGEQKNIANQPSDVMNTSVKTLAGIPFDVQPIPVEVPKRSISRELAAGR